MRRVVYARLHQGLHLKDVGDLGTVFPGNKHLEDFMMMTKDANLYLYFTVKGKDREVLIPSANVVMMDLAPEVHTSKSVKSVA